MPTIPYAGGSIDVDRLPNRCPICAHAIRPDQVAIVSVEHGLSGPQRFDIFFQCPEEQCRRGFIGVYSGGLDSKKLPVLGLQATEPFVPKAPTVPPEVALISPNFSVIHSQASAADTYMLNQVAGCGYRKSLEFLIKDYAVSLEPAASDAIKNSSLGSVIANGVSDANIKECARRAAWIGNDETHYLRTWVDKDIADLKILIDS